MPHLVYTLTSIFKQETVALSPDTQDGLYSFLVVNDLEQEERYKDLPFVKGEPHSRFFAGTPLTSQSGINLGCLFVLDSEPREELSDIEKDALGKVAELVMDYLLVSRQASEGRRASRLSRGLHLFVDGNSSFASDTHMSARSISTAHSVSSRTSLHHGTQSAASRNNELKLRPASSEPEDSPSQEDARPVSPNANPNDLSDAPSSTGSIQSSQSAQLVADNTSSSNHWLFQRAANLLRQSLDLDGAGGVMFLEAGNNSSEYVADGHCDPAESTKPAPVLALSTRNDPFSYQATSTLLDPAVNLDNAFLKQLTRRYPKGRLWSFHRDGTFSTAEDQPINETRKQRKKSKVSETSKLNELFPDASQVMFVPLWNATDSQWFAGCFCWTPQPTRVFSQAVDLSSVFAFGSSIMTEYSRVESIIADRQKGDFISSISHELRSPLHGVLAAAEFLGSTTLDQYQGNLLDTIDACCRTLLDTMNQVLDFSKIMSLERHKKAFKRGRNPCKTKPTEETETRMDPLILTDLALLAEDVVASVCLGHSHAQRPVTSVDSSTPVSSSLSETATREDQIDRVSEVDVILDIPDEDWMYKVQPGSLRRLLMNILGNSLKYTSKGRVCVSIATEEHSKSHLRHSGLEDMVTLTISDTGKGISKEFLRKHLFTPFSQEDPLSVGTGLGLSIVRGIVKALNGRIKIRSRQGQGTVVKILLPLERLAGAETPKSPTQEEIPDQNTPMRSSQIPRDLCLGKSAAILGIDPSHLDQNPFWASMARYITDWYGMRLVPFSTDGKINILFADERDLSTAQMQDIPTELSSLLVFCSDSSSRDDPKAQWSHLADSLAILNRPCGPQKLGRGIWSCLDQTPTSPTSLLPTTGVESVLPERSALARSPTTIGESGLIPLKNGGPPAADPSNPTQGSSNSDMNPSNRGATTNPQQDTPKRVALPASSLPVRNSPSSSCHSKTSSEKKSEPRVLVVDDNRINLHLMETFLNRRNIAVLDKADNGRAAVDAVERKTQGYDMIFMDLSMPYMDGFEATRAIRAIEKERNGCPPAKIIAFTGLSSQRDEFKALDSGVDLFLTKPVPFKEVARLVDEWKAQRIG